MLLKNDLRGSERATLIQKISRTRNIDSNNHLPGFDCCVLSVRRRVFQQHRPNIDIRRRHQPPFYAPLRVAQDLGMLLGRLVSDAVLDAAHDWLCLDDENIPTTPMSGTSAATGNRRRKGSGMTCGRGGSASAS